MTATSKKSIKTLLKQASLPVQTVQICVRGDLVAEHEIADRALREAQKSPSTDKEGGGVAELVKRIDALEAQMREGSIDFKIRALTRPRFRALLKAHPPRRDDNGDLLPGDAQGGFNGDTFFDALLKVSTIEPDMGVDAESYFTALLSGQVSGTDAPVLADGDWPELFEALTDRQYGDLTDAAWFINRNEVSVPFSLAASRAKRPSVSE